EDALQVCLGCLLEQVVQLFDTRILLASEGQVDYRNVGSGNAEGHSGQLSLGRGKNLTYGLCCTGGRGNNVLRGSASASPVLLRWSVNGFLCGCIGVDGRHKSGFDTYRVQKYLDDWCKT